MKGNLKPLTVMVDEALLKDIERMRLESSGLFGPEFSRERKLQDNPDIGLVYGEMWEELKEYLDGVREIYSLLGTHPDSVMGQIFCNQIKDYMLMQEDRAIQALKARK